MPVAGALATLKSGTVCCPRHQGTSVRVTCHDRRAVTLARTVTVTVTSAVTGGQFTVRRAKALKFKLRVATNLNTVSRAES